MNNSSREPDSLSVQFKQIARLGDQKYPSFELRVILRYLRQQGYEDWCTELMRSLDLVDADLDEPFVTAHQGLSALNQVMDEFFRPGLGHDIALNYTLSDLSAIGTCLRHADTLGEALEISNAYYDLIGSFNDLVNIADEISFTQQLVNVSNLDPRVMRFLFELTVSGSLTLAKELCGHDIVLQELDFEELLSTEDKAFYADLYGVNIVDDAKFYAWKVGLDNLASPVIERDPNPLESEQSLKALLEMLRGDQGLVGDIDVILRGSLGDFPDPDMISHALGISSRTLRRRLSRLGTSYSALMDKVRCQLAINLIQYKNLSNEALSAELGYSDAANFCNAFKKWTGKSPSYYRELGMS